MDRKRLRERETWPTEGKGGGDGERGGGGNVGHRIVRKRMATASATATTLIIIEIKRRRIKGRKMKIFWVLIKCRNLPNGLDLPHRHLLLCFFFFFFFHLIGHFSSSSSSSSLFFFYFPSDPEVRFVLVSNDCLMRHHKLIMFPTCCGRSFHQSSWLALSFRAPSTISPILLFSISQLHFFWNVSGSSSRSTSFPFVSFSLALNFWLWWLSTIY